MVDFTLIASDGGARAGEMVTPHGVIPTPVFMPVGSQATVKTLTPEEVRESGFHLILANTYHLYLRQGVEVIEQFGGLHRFMNWDGALLTDSGGYQIFSLAPLCKIDDEGVWFRSHIDGSEHYFTPELAVACQEKLGADIIMVLDECSACGDPEKKVAAAMERTHRWAERCLAAQRRSDLTLFAIVQGGLFPKLRRQSASFLAGLDFPGYAIGGLSVGEPKEVTFAMLEEVTPRLPDNSPRYLMGVGSPEDLVEGVRRGVDMFDCVLPTRVARNGALFTSSGRINIRKASYRTVDAPIDAACDCYTCRHFSTAYLNHLFKAEELLGLRLATIHNLRFLHNLMKRMRESIIAGKFESFNAEFREAYHPTDEVTRVEQKQRWLDARNSSGG